MNNGLQVVSLLVVLVSYSFCFNITFQAGTGNWHLGTLAVGNLVGSASSELEIVVPYRCTSLNFNVKRWETYSLFCFAVM